MKINFIFQKSFEDLFNPITNKKLFFDFYLPDYNICIEYDGQQHFNPICFGGKKYKDLSIKTFENTIKRDSIKNIFCEKNNIKLLRISYKDSIEESIKRFLVL